MFGKVYHVCNIKDGKEAAMKIEKKTQESVLKIEVEVMNEMKGQKAALQIYDDGVELNYRFIIMTLCGPDLTKIAEFLNNKFSDSSLLRIAIRTLYAIKTLHESGYVHRDLKPCNLALDYRRDSNIIFLLDFGMARRYARLNESQWIIRAPRSQCRFRGTVRYCSVNMHKRIELGRVDDLWSWLYMTLEMRTELPWAASLHPEKVEIQKVELISVVLNKDTITRSLIPIADHLGTLTYPDRPDYLMIFNTLIGKMQEVGAKLTDPLEFDDLRPGDCEKLQEVVKKYNINLQSKNVTEKNEEKEMELLKEGFQPAGIKDVPGGSSYVIAKGRNFYFTPKSKKSTTSDDKKEKGLGSQKSMTSLCVDINNNDSKKKSQTDLKKKTQRSTSKKKTQK
ncbi:unnamed protein product [Caenorhabditis bovis]|uniref:Protein kinase domain-containing protein n=1 Tax=Caenorhabditis bovis TaxID=2654633 RepID=A0A8S1EZL9_9PELO|nr:unnamed protein product [Caenorhabditis bovis]